ncbi:hypothetical protein ACFPU1_01130 [Thalassorhabdus alkalitolerans]|uniref:Uncharacterized protein n=1 Tax=Thalassorhabdus alkalitolerans TaxID=2282697 RepID=A0ABW0YGY8_9BACI|nr:hypothetical protein [Thalassobacillus sp. C254]
MAKSKLDQESLLKIMEYIYEQENAEKNEVELTKEIADKLKPYYATT